MIYTNAEFRVWNLRKPRTIEKSLKINSKTFEFESELEGIICSTNVGGMH